jgi:hypothetical protein
MSLQGELAGESTIEFLCKKLKEKIKKYPRAAKALKEVGIEMLDSLPNIPEWANKDYRFFRK